MVQRAKRKAEEPGRLEAKKLKAESRMSSNGSRWLLERALRLRLGGGEKHKTES